MIKRKGIDKSRNKIYKTIQNKESRNETKKKWRENIENIQGDNKIEIKKI